LLNIKFIKKHKKYLIVTLFWLLLLLTGLSLWKSKIQSTLAHIKSKVSWINYVVQRPLWYWLGTSGPAVHHNWTILPENYYLQLILDVGTIWFILWAVVMFNLLIIFKQIQHNQKHNSDPTHQLVYLLRKSLTIWRVCLLTMWLLLHVFEDWMVNYVFFIPYWILTGWLSRK